MTSYSSLIISLAISASVTIYKGYRTSYSSLIISLAISASVTDYFQSAQHCKMSFHNKNKIQFYGFALRGSQRCREHE